MRTIKQLLILLRRRMIWSLLFGRNDGLCGVIRGMYRDRTITISEADELRKYLDYNEPPEAWGAYYFQPGKIRPRYRFLTKLIKEL